MSSRQPQKKKARTAKGGARAASSLGGGAQTKSPESVLAGDGGPTLSSELIARVATYIELFSYIGLDQSDNPFTNDNYMKKLKIRGGAFAILMAFHHSQTDVLLKAQIIREGQKFCDEQMEANYMAGRPHGAWSGIKALKDHNFVTEQRARQYSTHSGSPSKYTLTRDGKMFIEALLANRPEAEAAWRQAVGTGADYYLKGQYIHSPDLPNLCLAVGPVISRIIKYSYLEKNLGYLNGCHSIGIELASQGQALKWVRECHLAWLSVNTNWRDLITDAVAEEFIFSNEESERENRDGFWFDPPIGTVIKSKGLHPFSALANPARAIQLGLINVLRFLVEDKGININGKHWKTYSWRTSPVHLLTVAINSNCPEAFDYLLSLNAIDFKNESTSFKHGNFTDTLFSSAVTAYVKEKNKHYFRALVQHPKFQANGRTIFGWNPDLRQDGKMTLLHMFVNHYTSIPMGYHDKKEVIAMQEGLLESLRLLMDAGADPNIEFDDYVLSSPLSIAKDNLRAASFGGYTFGERLVRTLQGMIKIMSEY